MEKVSERLNISVEMLINQNTGILQEEIETILFKIEEENRALSKEEESLFKLVLLEFIDPLLIIRVFTTLLEELDLRQYFGHIKVKFSVVL